MRRARHGAQPRDRQCRHRDLRLRPRDRGRPDGEAHRRHRRRAGRQGPSRPRRRRARQPDRRQGPDRVDRAAPRRREGAGHHSAQVRARADGDGPQGHRRADPDRPRPARAHHRRPPDRQDRHRARHDPQPEAAQPGRRREPEALLRLRRGRPEALDRRAVREGARGERRARIFDHRRRHRLRSGADAVPRAVLGLRHGRVLPRQRHARGHHLRRPVEAGRRLPPDVAAAAPPAGPRGLSGRRVLSAFAPARARREAQRRQRRGLAHRAAGHRDAGERRVGLHPDERHLDHRRPDLPRDRPVLPGHPPGGECRPLGVARRLLGADQGDEEGRRQDQGRACAVPRDGGLRAVRLRPRRRRRSACSTAARA